MSDGKDDKNIEGLTAEERRALLGRLLRERAAEAEGVRPAEPAAYPLSFAQQRLWFLDKLQPGMGTYNVCRAFWLRGGLDVARLGRAFEAVVGRHEALRTTFVEGEDGRSSQLVAPAGAAAFTIVDVRDELEPEAAALRLLAAEADRPFDLGKGPLFRQFLWQTADDDFLLLVVMHHIVSDAWSLSILFGEVSAVYGADDSGVLPPLSSQYHDYARSQRERLAGQALSDQLDFWRGHLAGRERLLELPTDRPRPPAQSFEGQEMAFALSKSLSEAVKAFSQSQKTTPYTTLLAAFNLLLARYSGGEDIIIGSPTANRHTAETQQLIGFFVNVMPLRTDLSGNPTFEELVGRVQQNLRGTLAHQGLPFERLVEAVQPERDLSRHPVFQVVFAMQNVPDDVPRFSGVAVTGETVPVQRAKFDLTFFLRETEAGFAGSIEYSRDLFEGPTIERMAGHFEQLLAGAMAEPSRRIQSLPLLTAGERSRLVREWNRTARNYSCDRLVHQLVEEQAARRGEQTAVISYQSAAVAADGLTYGELNGRANQLARYLRRLGVGPETAVAVCMTRSLEMVVALLGVLKAGAAYLPLDPVYPRERLAFMIQDAARMTGTAEPILLTQPWLEAAMPGDGVRQIVLDSSWEAIGTESRENLEAALEPENPAYIIYTSGTTGRPKGITLEHRSLLNLIYWHQRAFEVTAESRATHLAGPAFDAAVWELWPYLTAGATIHIPDEETRLLPWAMRDWLISRAITISFQPTPLAEAMLALDWPAETPLRRMLTGGDKLAHFPPEDLPFDLVNNYGPTENTVVTTSETTEAPGLAGESLGQPAIGRPIDNVQVYITDQHMNLVPVGVPGELLIGGQSLARGYLARPDLTAAAFVPDPFSGRAGERLYRTGDSAKYLADGRIAFLGRIDQQVKIRGFRIELGEIEAVLGQHSAVGEALVVARDDGPGEKQLVGYVIPAPETVFEADGVRAYLGERLPEYMVPAVFVSLREWPLTPNGKIDRRALPGPDWSGLGQGREYSPPTTAEEEKLAAIWQGVLGLEQVGIHDNFFELGGDSILSIQILARANQAGFQLTTRQLFQHQTIAALAASRGPGAETAELTPADQGLASGGVPLTPIQRWFFKQSLASADHWNMSLVLEAVPGLSVAVVEEAFQHLLAHHDALRLRFVNANGRWQQFFVNPTGDEAGLVRYVNLDGLPGVKRQAEFLKTAESAHRSLNLADGPLLGVVYFDYGPEENGRLLIVVHHLVVDGVSWRVLAEDLALAYAQIAAGEGVRLPEKTVSIQQWGKALVAYGGTAEIQGQSGYWLGLPWQEVRPLPRDFAAPEAANTVGTAVTVSTRLTRQATQALLQAVPAAYGSQINDILLAALAESVAGWAEGGRLLVDLEGHGREPLGERPLDVSRTVGWFTSLYPVLLPIGEGMSGTAAVRAVQEQLARVPGKGLGYGLLRYGGQDEETAERLERLPQAELSFNYLGQFDSVLAGGGAFSLSLDPGGPNRSPESGRQHLLNINGRIIDGRLEMSWTFSRSFHQQTTIERLAADYQAALLALIEERPVNGVPRAVYEGIVGAVEAETVSAPIEALAGLGPGQAAMVGHWRRRPGSAAYFLQWDYGLRGAVDGAALRRAWETAVERHEALRTAFVVGSDGRAYQVVLAQAGLDWQELDWRALSEEERRERLEEFLRADRAAGFRLDGPLKVPMRFGLIRFGEADWRLVWSHHHALLDGWSMGPLWQEVLRAYTGYEAGAAVDLEPVVPFGRYLDWLRRQRLYEARDFWRERLAGLEKPAAKRGTEGGTYGWLEAELTAEETAALSEFARKNRLTVNTLVQGAWARALAAHQGRQTVVFGVTATGRPSTIPGVSEIVGLMLNTLPLRAVVPEGLDDEAARIEWLRGIQEGQAGQRPYEYVSLEQVAGWLGFTAETPLFDSFLRFQNYPMKAYLAGWEGGFRIVNKGVYDVWGYPMSVVVVPGERLVLRLGFDGGLIEEERAAGLLAGFKAGLGVA